jgi:hypothetical protein
LSREEAEDLPPPLVLPKVAMGLAAVPIVVAVVSATLQVRKNEVLMEALLLHRAMVVDTIMFPLPQISMPPGLEVRGGHSLRLPLFRMQQP